MKRKLFLLLCALLTLVGTQKVQAYTTEDLTNDGWTLVTDLGSLTLGDNYFVFVDGAHTELAMSHSGAYTDARPVYQLLQSPAISCGEVWMLEASNGKYIMQNYSDNYFYSNGGAGWNSSMKANTDGSNSEMTFTLNEGKYHISGNGGALGTWSNYDLSGGGLGYAGTAGNKSVGGEQDNGFYLYYLPRTSYLPINKPSEIYSTAGWMPVEALSDWGNDKRQYVLVDYSESGFESNMIMTGTENGLPQYKYYDLNDSKQKWYTEASGDGYALKNVEYGTYSNYTAPWSGNMSAELPAKVFVPSLNNGKWQIKNTVDNSNWLGRWGDSDNGKNAKNDPFAGEQLAANKGVGNGRRFFLVYAIPSAVDYAVALPASGDMTANNWYFFDIIIADNYKATSTQLENIECIEYSTGNSVTLEATGNSLAATRYYVKSSTNNNLVIAAASYSYSVSEATVDKAYIQPGNTVTVSYTVSTNNPSAVLSQDYSGVTFDGKSINDVEPTGTGFTFTVPADIEAGTEHTLYIPEGAIGYAVGNTYNAEQSFTLKTPVVFDGVYYFKVENEGALKGQYLSRGRFYGTHATVDKYGLAIKVATDDQNRTTLKSYDTDRFYRMDSNGWNCWADNTDNDDRAKFNLVAYNGHILVHGITTGQADDYFKYNDGDVAETTVIWGDSHGTSGANGNAIEFSLDDASAQAAAMQALKDAQATTAASAAYASGQYESLDGITTLSDLEEELDAHYAKGDLIPATTVTSVLEKYQGGQPGYNNTVEIVYSDKINITEPGLYKFSMQAFYRAGDNERTQDMHDKNIDRSPVVLYFGSAETQIKSLYDEPGSDTEMVPGNDAIYHGQYYANNPTSALMMLQTDKYHNDVYLYIGEAGEYTYGVKYLGYANNNAQWFIYSPESVTVTIYGAAADAGDYAALADAIDAFDNAVWGFETAEYAPYNNVEVLENIEAAKAINPDETNSKLLVKSLTDKIALSDPNASEVNAIYWPVYTNESAKDAGNRIYALGWGKDGGTDAYNTRVVVGTTESNVGIYNYLENHEGLMTKFATNYGVESGYTMPLKANTMYKLSFKYGGMENTPNVTISFTDPEDNIITLKPDFMPTYANAHLSGDEDQFEDYAGYFVTNSAGNYVLNLTKDPTTQQQIAMGNIELKKVASQTLVFADDAMPTFAPGVYPAASYSREIPATSDYGTICVPFNVTTNEDIQYFTLGDIAENVLSIEYADNIEAGVPAVFKKKTADATSIEVTTEDATVVNAVVEQTGDPKLVGTFVDTTVDTNAEYCYYIKNNQFWQGNTSFNVGSFRAYIETNSNTGDARLTIEVDGETAINTLKTLDEKQGLKDGKYLIGGKIIVVKEGKQYNVNGVIK